MSYGRNMPDWQQYNALQSGGAEATKSGQNVSSSHHYVPNISPPSLNGLNLSTDCHSKSQNDVINYSQRNYQPSNNTPSGPNNLVEPPLASMVHVSSCVGHYGASSSMNSMMDDANNVDLRNGSVAALNEEMAHRNQISLNGPISRVMGPNMNVSNNMGTAGPRIPPANTVPSNRQGPYMSSCKGPCCVTDPNINYQAWEKFNSYTGSNPYRDNIRTSGYAAESRRYRNEMAYRKESYTSKDLIPPNSYHVDQRRNFPDYKYCKDPTVSRNYQPSTVLPNYPLPNYSVPSDYQKYAYTMKDYPRQEVVNTQNSGIIKYSEHNVNMQDKYSPKQSQYQSGALLQKGLVVPSISTNISSVQSAYLNPQFSREYQWDNHEKDVNKIQNPVSMHSAYPKYQLYQQKYAMQRYSMENHLRELSRIPGYQSHPKYQECILRYRELLRLQQTVDYQSAIQNTLTSANSAVPPINLQFDQNGVLINSTYLPSNFPTSHNPINSLSNPVNLEKEQHNPSEKANYLQRLQHLPIRSQQERPLVQNSENNPREVQYLNQKTAENPHCQVTQGEEERFETSNPSGEEHKDAKNFANKQPVLDVRHFLANWDEAEEEEGANANLPDVVLSNSTPIVVVEYGNVGMIPHGSENTDEQKTENEPSMKSQEYFQKEQSNASLLQECTNDLNQGVVFANKLNIKCVGEGIDGVPTIHIVENTEEEFAYNEKAEMEVSVGILPSLTETKECEVDESKEASTSLNYKKLTRRNSDPKLQINPQDLSILPLSKSNPEAVASNLKKQNSFTNEENHNSDDLSLPDLTTSECTPISTTLNTPTHSDSEESSHQGVDLTTSTNPIELIQNSPMISFTQSPVKMDPYEHLKGGSLSRKSSQDELDFDFQGNTESVIKSQVLDHKKESNEKTDSTLENNNLTSEEQNGTKYSRVHSMSQIIPENSANKDSSAFSSNLDVFSSEDQDKWCWNSIPLIPGEENEEPKIPAPPMEENDLTKIMKESAPITSLNVLESDEEKTNKVDDMWLEVGCMDKGLNLSSETKTSSNEKLYNEPDPKIQNRKEISEVSTSVSKILKNIEERQNSIQNSMQDSNNVRNNPKGISIISEEIFNSTWRRNTQNKMYPPFRKMSDSFEREEIESFAEMLKNPERSRSRSLETNIIRNRSRSAENLRTDNKEEEQLLLEFENLKRKRSIDHCQEENKLPKLYFEREKEQDLISGNYTMPVTKTDAFINESKHKNDNDQKELPMNENKKKMDSDLEIKFRNSCDSSKPFEAIKIEINVSRTDSKTVNQTLSQPQKCNEPDYKGNKEDPSTCGSVTCFGRHSNCRSSSKTEMKVQNQKTCEDLDKINSEKIAEKSRIQGEERKESVIEYLGKAHHPNNPKVRHSACDSCESLNFHKIDKEYTCTHLDNRKLKPRESAECFKNSLETSDSAIECLSNRLKSISKSKPIDDFSRKSKLQDLKHLRKLKYKDTSCFSGYENTGHRVDKMDVDENLEMLPCTSEFSGYRSSQTNNLLEDDLSNTSDDAKHFVIKNSLNYGFSNFDEIPYKASENNHQGLKSNLLDRDDSQSPKGFLNPLFNSEEEVENLNTVPVYTTKDGKITYSPNPRFTYRILLMEAREKESRSYFEKSSNYTSTSQEKRSTKSSEKRSFSNKYQTDLKPPKKSLAKRFATQELEKSYQRYLSHKENKSSSFNNEPMVIKTIKNYNVLNETTSGNEAQDEKQPRKSNHDFDDIHLQIEQGIDMNCHEEKVEENLKDTDEIPNVLETSTENQIERIESQVFTEIRSPSPGDTEDNQVVPVVSSDKDSVMETDDVTNNKSTSVPTVVENIQNNLEGTDNSIEMTEVDKVQSPNVDFSLSNPDLQPELNLEKDIDIQDSNKKDSTSPRLDFVKNFSLFESINLPLRRKSTSDIESQSAKLIQGRRKSESFVKLNLNYPEISEVCTEKEISTSSQVESSETHKNSDITENSIIAENIEKPNTPKDIEIENNQILIDNEPESCSEYSSIGKEEGIEANNENIHTINIENEQRKIESPVRENPVFLSPIRKEDNIEVIEVEDDEVFIVEPEPKISQDSEICDNLNDSRKTDMEEIIESNVGELKSSVNENEEAKIVTSRLDMEPETEISNVITKENVVGQNEALTLNIEETSSNIAAINSGSKNVQEDVLIFNQENKNKPAEERVGQSEFSRNENEYPFSDFDQEVEIVSEMIEKQMNKESIENSIQNRAIEIHFEENNSKNEKQTNELELKSCEREYLETRGLSPLPESNSSTEALFDKNVENTKEITEKNSNEECSTVESIIETNQSEFQVDDLPLITEEHSENDDAESVYIDDESSCEVDPPILEVQKELSDSEMLNSPKSSDSNQFDRMPDVTLEANVRRESHSKSQVVKKMVPKLVIRKIETNRNCLSKSVSADANMEPSFYRKIPKMIIRNAKSRPTTPTIEEIPDELPLSNEESNVIKVKIRLDDINKNESYMFANEESRIPKMKIKLEDKLPKVVIENLDIRNSQELHKLVPKVKIKKLKNFLSLGDDSKTNYSKTNDSEMSNSHSESSEQTNFNSESLDIVSDTSVVESDEIRNRIPKLKIKKDLKIASSNSRKRYSSGVSQTENKKAKRNSKEEAKQDGRLDLNMENSMSSSDCQSNSEKVPKVIIKRTSPTAEFKCEVSNDKKNPSIQDASLQPQVVLQRSWILDCMAKELRHVNIALKLAIAKNGNKASVRGKSNSSKIQWEQFIRSLKKQKELSKTESGSESFSNKFKQRRKSDVGLRYFDPSSRLYRIKASKSAREATSAETNYLDNRSLYFKDMFSEKRIQKSQNNTFETWKKFDENMNSENKDIFQDPEKLNFPNHFGDYSGESDGNQREVKLDDDMEIKCPLLSVEEIDSKTNLVSHIGISFESFDENEVNVIKTEEESQITSEARPEFATSLIANGEHEYLYSEDAIPTQFEFELEIVDSSVDTYDVPIADIKELPESNDAVDLGIPNDKLEVESTNDSDRLPRLFLPDEDSSLTNTARDSSCDIKDEIPVLNNLLNSANTAQNFNHLSPSSSVKLSDSISLVQEVMAAKEMLRRYLPKCGNESTSSKTRPRTLAEKKQGTGFSLADADRICSAAKETSEHSSSRSRTRYEKKRPKESSRSREKHKSRKMSRLEEEPCKYDHNTISLRDQKRSSLHSIQPEESSKTKDSGSRSKTSDSNSKRSESKSGSRNQKTIESSKDSDRNKMKSYKIPKISKSKENSGEHAIEFKPKEEMPILEPEGGMNLDPSSDRDASLSPPVITNQEDVEIFEEDSKIFDTNTDKEDRVPCRMTKAVQVDPGVTLADAVQKWVFHEKATIKHRRYCVLCERWFPSVIRHRRHLSGYQHRHTELTQRRTIHTLFMLFTGKPCPRLLPADILRSDCSLGEPTPLQIAVQNVTIGYEKAHEMSKTKDEGNKQ